jgi:hypothetical protein
MAAVLAVAGCGTSDNPGAPLSSFNAKARKTHKHPPPATPGEESVADMVAAVSATKTDSPVQVKFTLAERPELGQEVDLRVVVLPGAPNLDSLSMSFQVMDGLDIVDGADTVTIDKPADGTPVRHTLKLIPKRDGIFAVTAVVSTNLANQTTTRMYSIPVIAGAGLPELAAKPEVAKGL